MARKTIAAEIAELRQMTIADLVERYEALHGRPPRSKNRSWLWRRCAWKLQEARFGGLSETAKRRLQELIGEIEIPAASQRTNARGTLCAPRRGASPAPGNVLVRQYKGREIRVTAVEGGFTYDGVVYKSLTAVARSVTGSAWNGRLFFGLSVRKKS